jgi:Ca2+-binding RTX toxin-like protein
MFVESLESRRLLAVTAAAFHDTLYVWGDNNNNGMSVEKVGTNYVVKEYQGSGVGYQQIFSTPVSSVSNLRMYGYDGNDTFTVHNNVTLKTTIMGGRGADWMKGGGGETYLYGHGNWADDPSTSHRPNTDDNAADTLVSGTGKMFMYGQGGNDSFHTSNGASYGLSHLDYIWGGNGNDSIHLTGKRQVYAFGDSGNDTFHVYSSNQKANIYGGGGTDTVDYGNFGQSVAVKPDGVFKSGARHGTRNQIIDTSTETIRGTPFNDWMMGTSGNNNFFGMAGNDELHGAGGNDLLDGGEGNDFLYGGSGNDTLFGQAGNDKLYGESGNDVMVGGDGNDSMYGGSGNDYMLGGSGNDLMYGGSGNDTLYGEAGTDWLYGDGGNNKLVGGAGSDFIYAKNGGIGDLIFGDNENGSGSAGAFDVVVIDRIWIGTGWLQDQVFGAESISY